jgi:hypothetical protein
MALADFLGERGIRSESEDVRLIYGAVFDPEEAAAKQANTRNQIMRPVKVVPPEDSFGWDDDELDAPIDPEDVRRKFGSRISGVSHFGGMKRKPKAKKPE